MAEKLEIFGNDPEYKRVPVGTVYPLPEFPWFFRNIDGELMRADAWADVEIVWARPYDPVRDEPGVGSTDPVRKEWNE